VNGQSEGGNGFGDAADPRFFAINSSNYDFADLRRCRELFQSCIAAKAFVADKALVVATQGLYEPHHNAA
jgi:hypothetical protein